MRELILETHCVMEDLQDFGSCLFGCCLHRIHSFNVCSIIEVYELSGDLEGQKEKSDTLKMKVLTYRQTL